jgi:hypothetical protein
MSAQLQEAPLIVKIFLTENNYPEVVSKRFSLVKVKAGDNFNRRNTRSISRIEI